MQTRQSGITLIGFIVILVIAGFFAYMAMKLAPPYIKYYSITKAMDQTATEGVEGKTKSEIRREFEFKLNFQYADDVMQPRDITFEPVDSGTRMKVDYDQRVHFVYNIDFLLHFDNAVLLKGNLMY
ncbi:MAG TPA: DUF4845 domain-containing protein [Oleiagrimonas sp.]|nr:DUF4845 domain-containing protein [Oleiagrimonas sp.]